MLATNPIRRMFVSRSSFENPSPFERFSRTSSPSRTSTRQPFALRIGVRCVASVLLPAPESPVNQRMKPLSLMNASSVVWRGGNGSANLAFEVRHLEALVVHDRTVAEVAAFAEELAVVGSHDHVRVLRNGVEELGDHAVDVAHRVDLPRAELVELRLVEELAGLRGLVQLAFRVDLSLELLEDA